MDSMVMKNKTIPNQPAGASAKHSCPNTLADTLTTLAPNQPGGGKRKAVSYDTGTSGDKGTRYQAIKAKILTGELRPSTSQLRKHWQCNYETAAAYLLAMAEEGLLVMHSRRGYESIH
jgi:hypothetical protein